MIISAYIRGPASAETRRRMSVAQRRRLGIPDGHVQIYGEHVPEEHAAPMRYWAYWIAWKFGRAEAEKFVREQTTEDYPDIVYLRDQWRAKMGASAVRDVIRSIRKAVFHAN